MFPYVMIFSTLIFFSTEFHKNVISIWRGFLQKAFIVRRPNEETSISTSRFQTKPFVTATLILFFGFQLLFPWRFLLYPGKLFWTEQGYRFSWRVMLMEKAGTAFFYVKDAKTGKESEVMNCDFLTKNQEKMMATQPDMIVQFAHYLKEKYEQKGMKDPQVRVESYVTLNGSGSRLFLDSTRDLTKENESFSSKDWILPFIETK
jgi:hypothetical protein